MAISTEVKSLNQVDYSFGVHGFLLFLMVITSFTVSFLANYPLEKKVESLLKAQLATVPGCRMNFERLRFEFFFPKVILTDVTLPASCLGGKAPLTLQQVSLHFHGPSFAPLGLALKLTGQLQDVPLSIHYAAGLSDQVFNIQETKLPLKTLGQVFPSMPKLEGQFDLYAKLSLSGQTLSGAQLAIESQNFVIVAQNLNDLVIPRLAIGNFLLKAETQGANKLVIKELILGKAEAPIRGKLTGTVNLAPGAIAMSPVDIRGEAAFSAEFTQAFPLINFMLQQFTQKDGFYQIRLGGTLGNIKPL